MEMCLHALSYQGPGWSFQTSDLPAWTSPFALTADELSEILGDPNAVQTGFDGDED